MNADRGGEGPVVASGAAKQTLGRSFQRVATSHQGQRADPTHYVVEFGSADATPLPSDMQLLFDENPQTVKTLRAAGLSDQAIFEQLDRQS